MFGTGIGVPALLTLITPWCARRSVYLLLTIRIMEGVFEGVTTPCISALWSKWAPPLERTMLATLAFSGCYVGTLVSMPASAYLATVLGWPSIFYLFGSVSLVWFVIWWIFVAESPAEDPRISKEELEYIQNTLVNVDCKRNIRNPWKRIFTSKPVLAIVVAQFTYDWGFYMLFIELPTFMKGSIKTKSSFFQAITFFTDILKFDLGQSGILSSLPYLAMAVMLPFSGQVADWFRKKKCYTTTQIRKSLTCGSFVTNAALMLAATFSTSSTLTVVCLVLAGGLGVWSWSGFG
jgi:ACS family sodium-dependent inorganic phosphate cotransporter